MDHQLRLENIRDVLIRLEETILFALIERAQFKWNPIIYERGAFPAVAPRESLVGYLLHETESIHARMSRYTSPDEYPFSGNLPAPVLPSLHSDRNPLHSHTVNLNRQIRTAYEDHIVSIICGEGDDRHYGSSAVCDVACLQALSRRIHYGMFVAESKYCHAPEMYSVFIDVGDRDGIVAAITDAEVEACVLKRVARKAERYGQDVDSQSAAGRIAPEKIVRIYRDGIIPLTKKVEVEYLLRRHP